MAEIIWKPSPERIEQANVTRLMRRHGLEDYEALIRWSITDIGRFWEACLEDLGIDWYRPFTRVLDASDGIAATRWFLEGQINLIHNCLDRHQKNYAGKTALIWEGDDGSTRSMSYGALGEQVGRTAGALIKHGIGKGDAVALYMPMVPEMVVAFYACLKIGVAVIPVFSGFGAKALATRLAEAEVKLLFTADGSYRRGRKLSIKDAADQALDDAPTVKHVVMLRRTGDTVSWQAGRDISWEDFVAAGTPVETEVLPAEHVAMILFTSGTTGKPKGCVHTHAGCQAQMAKELAYYFDVKADSNFFWVTDIGWMMGPWELIGVHTLGGCVTIFEGAPDYPHPGRLWEIVARHRISHLGISPTAIRLLKTYDAKYLDAHDLSSLQFLGSTGEAWDPESYQWFFEKVGKSRCPIINISGGTELVGCLLSPLPITELKPCSLRGPGLGMDVDVFNESGQSVREEVGYLVCKQPAPSMTKGFLNDWERYLETYFSKWPGIWNHGDWAIVDADGQWYLRGRADDTIKIAGRRTGPAEIEAALMEHDAVVEAAAVGVPHDIKGSELVCFVVLNKHVGSENAASLQEELKQLVVQAMGKALTPREIHIVKGLPKTRSAKIVRGIIQRKFLGMDLGDTSSVENPTLIDEIPISKQTD